MPFTLIPFDLAPLQSDESVERVDADGDFDLGGSVQAKQKIVTPGETITNDPQWMRYSCLVASGGALG